MTCARCAIETPRLTLTQRYCPPCGREVAALIKSDAERRQPRFERPKDLTGALR
jgi:predicted RNA-binding Zn-ribbon protein involved in translation (DUF1610 family)